jgi:hypothetical protein
VDRSETFGPPANQLTTPALPNVQVPQHVPGPGGPPSGRHGSRLGECPGRCLWGRFALP